MFQHPNAGRFVLSDLYGFSPSAYPATDGFFGTALPQAVYVQKSITALTEQAPTILPGQLSYLVPSIALALSTQVPTISIGAWDQAQTHSQVTLSNHYRTASELTNVATLSTRSSIFVTTPTYAEVLVEKSNGEILFGICGRTVDYTVFNGTSSPKTWLFNISTGNLHSNTETIYDYTANLGVGTVVGLAYHAVYHELYFSINGVWVGTSNPVTRTAPAFTGIINDPVNDPIHLILGLTYGTAGVEAKATGNFFAKDLVYDAPDGYYPWSENKDQLPPIVSRLTPQNPKITSSLSEYLNNFDKTPLAVLSNGFKTLQVSTTSSWQYARTLTPKTSGKWYFEGSFVGNGNSVGVASTEYALSQLVGNSPDFEKTWIVYINTSGSFMLRNYNTYYSLGSYTNNTRFRIAIDLDTDKMWVAVGDAAWYGGGDPTAGTLPGLSNLNLASEFIPFACCFYEQSTLRSSSIFCESWDLLYAPPENFLAWGYTEGDLYVDSSASLSLTAVAPTHNIPLPPTIDFDFEDGLVPTGWTVPVTADAGWSIDNSTTYEGTYSLKSNTISNSQTAEIEYTHECIPGNLIFAYQVSSEAGYDFLRFYVNDIKIAEWSGVVNWSVYVYPTIAAIYTFRWTYEKDSSAVDNLDSAWIDLVKIPYEEVTALKKYPPEINLSLTPQTFAFGNGFTIPEIELPLVIGQTTSTNLENVIRFPFPTHNPTTNPQYFNIRNISLSLTAQTPTTFSRYLRGFDLIFPGCQVFNIHSTGWETSYGYAFHHTMWASVSQAFHTSSYRSESVAELHTSSWSFTGSKMHTADYASLSTTVASTEHTATWASLGTESVTAVHDTSYASLGTESVTAIHDTSYQSALLSEVSTTHSTTWASLGTESAFTAHDSLYASLGVNAVSAKHDTEWYSLSEATRVFSLHETSWTVTPDILALHSTAWKSVIAASEIHGSRWQSKVDNFRFHEVRYRSNTTTPTIQDGLVYVRV